MPRRKGQNAGLGIFLRRFMTRSMAGYSAEALSQSSASSGRDGRRAQRAPQLPRVFCARSPRAPESWPSSAARVVRFHFFSPRPGRAGAAVSSFASRPGPPDDAVDSWPKGTSGVRPISPLRTWCDHRARHGARGCKGVRRDDVVGLLREFLGRTKRIRQAGPALKKRFFEAAPTNYEPPHVAPLRTIFTSTEPRWRARWSAPTSSVSRCRAGRPLGPGDPQCVRQVVRARANERNPPRQARPGLERRTNDARRPSLAGFVAPAKGAGAATRGSRAR